MVMGYIILCNNDGVQTQQQHCNSIKNTTCMYRSSYAPKQRQLYIPLGTRSWHVQLLSTPRAGTKWLDSDNAVCMTSWAISPLYQAGMCTCMTFFSSFVLSFSTCFFCMAWHSQHSTTFYNAHGQQSQAQHRGA